MLQKDFAPGQTRVPGFPSDRHPGAVLPLGLGDAAAQLCQGLRGRFSLTDITPDPFDLGPDLVVPPLELRTIDLQKKLHLQLAHPRAKFRVDAVGAIPQDRRRRHSVAPGLAKNLRSQLRLGGKAHFLRDPHIRAAFPILGPTRGQIRAPTHGSSDPSVADHHLHAHLAVGLLADRTAVLMRHPNGVGALLDPTRLVDHPGFQRLQVRNDLMPDRRPHRFLAPRAVGHELLQTLRVHPQPLRHGDDGLPLRFHGDSEKPPAFLNAESFHFPPLKRWQIHTDARILSQHLPSNGLAEGGL